MEDGQSTFYWEEGPSEPSTPSRDISSMLSEPELSTSDSSIGCLVEHIQFDGKSTVDPRTNPIENNNLLLPEENEVNEVRASEQRKIKQLSKDAETYNLYRFPSNQLYIFNHTIAGTETKRLGTEKDVEALKDTFNKYSFKIHEFDDCTQKEIFNALHALAMSDLDDVGCIVIVVLSHGDKGGMIWAKDIQYHESNLLNIFRKSNNPSLGGKPILFFIQACRGGLDQTRKLAFDAVQMESYTLPEEADMLMMHSTYQGMPSLRDTLDGSWFIQTLCDNLNKYEEEPLLNIIRRVQKEIAVDREASLANGEIYKQMPVCMTTLTRNLYFRESPVFDKLALDSGNEDNKVINIIRKISTGLNIHDAHRRSFSTNDASAITIDAHCSDCQEECANYFQYMWGIFQQFTETNQDLLRDHRVLIEWQKVADKTNMQQMKSLTKCVAEILVESAKDWTNYQFIYFGEYTNKK